VQVGQLGNLAEEQRAAFALLGSRALRPPHGVVGDELPSSFERIEQGERPVGPDQREVWIDLNHRQAPTGRGDRVAFAGVCLLPGPQFVEFGSEGGPVDDRRLAGGR
jgi:hypothetical protein